MLWHDVEPLATWITVAFVLKVTCRAVGIGSYLVRLGQRVIQVENAHVILTGARALNKVIIQINYEVLTTSHPHWFIRFVISPLMFPCMYIWLLSVILHENSTGFKPLRPLYVIIFKISSLRFSHSILKRALLFNVILFKSRLLKAFSNVLAFVVAFRRFNVEYKNRTKNSSFKTIASRLLRCSSPASLLSSSVVSSFIYLFFCLFVGSWSPSLYFWPSAGRTTDHA